MKAKATKYTSIRQVINCPAEKSEIPNGLAYVTHFLHNANNGVSHYYKEQARNYLLSIKEISDLVNDESFNYFLPIQWDVPFPAPKNPDFKFIDLFAGIGGFRIAFQKLNGKCVFSSEINESAKQTYEKNFGEWPFGDIKDFTGPQITDEILNKLIADHDVLTGGFPCQPFSLAGVSARNHLGLAHGFKDTKQGNLFFDIARIIEVKRPAVVFLENVKNFESHDGKKTFDTVKSIIKDLGYDFHSKVINANKVVPQNRQRFYMVCFREENNFFSFPEFDGNPKPLRSILEKNVPDTYTISDRLWNGHQRRTEKNLNRGTGFTAFVADLDKPSNTIVARYGKDGKECLIPQSDKNPRKLTPLECARLQGFPDNYILPSSNAAAYRQFGNSVAVPVIEAIGKNILDSLQKLKLSKNGV